MKEFVIGKEPSGVYKVEGRYCKIYEPFQVILDTGHKVEFKSGGVVLFDNSGNVRGCMSFESFEKGAIDVD